MKKLIIIAIAFVSLQTIAQEHHNRRGDDTRKEQFKDMNPEELAQLKTKHMTLRLDLDDSQQDKVYALLLEQTKARKEKAESLKGKEKKELSKDEKLKMANDRLDAQIAFKKEMKIVLNEEQYKKFERSTKRKGKHQRKGKQKRRS
ncbi:hypothetical protein RM697_10485 [Ichthyenterobacterium sp. W332]|uniref:Uncharacterized protein n=1 Tax=Microcosmobacter mediterraneus TaxID=3075607 RepID=A0ABU2YPV4_9FLAO|nr:hypothetical protein [Ichthyenterobacterium sp. W332]MDT0559078.1 hypothetical protein [Ichthyenterobacterium sp. W332]